eukprot:TRINITY_DN5143_c0_g1_i1.p1 TRINITY_DN5143_c0_g1~~TRINITY_DN5143_c0_g1_i1.p1  ORF type:complete len:758 (+),score=220.71 TRINITY_DN5143_c0_g1_i1:195-2468(+)
MGKKTVVSYHPDTHPIKKKVSPFPEPVIESSAQSSGDMITTLIQGQVPRNEDLCSALEKTKFALEEKQQTGVNGDAEQLSPREKQLLNDTKNIIATTQKLLNEKNQGEILQSLIHHSKEASKNTVLRSSSSLKESDSSVRSEKMKDTAKEAKELAAIFLSSNQFRMLIIEALDLIRSLLLVTSAEGRRSTPVTLNFQDTDQFNDILKRVAAKSEYRKAVKNIFDLLDVLQKRMAKLKKDNAASNDHFVQIAVDLQHFIEQFTGENTVRRIFDTLLLLVKEVKTDQNAVTFFKQLRIFVVQAIKAPTALNSSEQMNEAQNIIATGKILFASPRYRELITSFVEQSRAVLLTLKSDAVVSEFTSAVQHFAQHLLFDADGRPDMDSLGAGLKQLKGLVFPILAKNLDRVVVPRVSGTNDTYDFAIENLIFHGSSLIPTSIGFKVKSAVELDVPNMSSEQKVTHLTLIVRDMKTHFENVQFWFKRKTFPKIEDRGLIDVNMMRGEGIAAKIQWTIRTDGKRATRVDLRRVKVTLDKLDIRIHESKHSFLDKMSVKLFASRIKKELAKSIAETLILQLDSVDSQLNQYLALRPGKNLKMKIGSSMRGQPPIFHSLDHQVPVPHHVERHERHERHAPVLGALPVFKTVYVEPPKPETAHLPLADSSKKETSSVNSVVPSRSADASPDIPRSLRSGYLGPSAEPIARPIFPVAVLLEREAATSQRVGDSSTKPFGWFQQETSNSKPSVHFDSNPVTDINSVNAI